MNGYSNSADRQVLPASADLMMLACHAVHGLSGHDPAAAAAAVRAALSKLRPGIPPEVIRVELAMAASLAWEHGVMSVPAQVTDPVAEEMLRLAGDWAAAGTAAADGATLSPALEFASVAAFDRNPDDVLTSLATLLALAHLAAHAQMRDSGPSGGH